MANNLKFLGGTFKTVNRLFLRPHSTFRSSLLGRNSTLVKKNNILFTNVINQNQTVNSTNSINQMISNGNILNRSVASTSSGSTAHWNSERYLSVFLLAAIPAGLLLENSVVDQILAVSLVLHSHWGLQQIVTDYVHGPTLPKLALGLLYAVSALTLAGLVYFNYSDIGISKAVKKIWSL